MYCFQMFELREIRHFVSLSKKKKYNQKLYKIKEVNNKRVERRNTLLMHIKLKEQIDSQL